MRLGFKPQTLERRLQMVRNGSRGLHSTIRCTLLCCRLIGLFPLSGLWHPSSDRLKFTLRSPYTIFYVISLFGQCLMFALSFFWLLQHGMSLTNVSNSLFYSSSLISSVILMNIARFWPRVIMRAEEIEGHLPPFSRDKATLCNITIFSILFSAFVEHALSVVYGLATTYLCSADNIVETYFRYNMPWIFHYTSYTLWKGVISEIFNIQSTFIWSFNDSLIMDSFSAESFRTQYLLIVRLVKLINRQVGIYILTSFGCNLYWICTQMFYTLNKTQTGHFITCHEINLKNNDTLHRIEHSVYFTYSLSFLVARTLLLLILGARIHSNSKVPVLVLYSLPSEKFDIEVERYMAQINDIKVALSGLDFFDVTRTMIISLLGTVATYELVLYQINK